eukprot:TRINITY_DN61399_c1_g1_i2.p2 TRINITY_DN61399_c1_g1~~TRINITY_DN61399_c1_g1_i2.p2  ORF type:complete len:191 (+),score=76.65 TRINITY_DN61399_c1_g1_i2:218-790(+)
MYDSKFNDGLQTDVLDSFLVAGGAVAFMAGGLRYAQDWILPKGGWEEDEPLAEHAAQREAWEEGGVLGGVLCKLGEMDFASRKGNPCRMHGFLLLVHEAVEEYPERLERKRRWFDVDEALKALSKRPMMTAFLQRAQRWFAKDDSVQAVLHDELLMTLVAAYLSDEPERAQCALRLACADDDVDVEDVES